jgi:hypothetical protein
MLPKDIGRERSKKNFTCGRNTSTMYFNIIYSANTRNEWYELKLF